MTGSRVDRGPHIDDGDLIRLFDGECSPEEAEQIRNHVEACPECADNSVTLVETSSRLTSMLAELETSAPPELVLSPDAGTPSVEAHSAWQRFGSSRVLRAAAVLAVTVLVFTATPARALFVQGWEALRSLVVEELPESSIVDEAPEIARPTPSSVISFTPSGPTFRLEFTNRPAAGTLLLMFDSAATASAGLIGGDVTDGMILLPYGLRIHNSARSSGSFEIRLPLSLSSVHVSIAGDVQLVVDVESSPGPFTRELDLAGDGGR